MPFTIHGRPCPELADGELVAVSCGGHLTAVPKNSPGSRSPGPLFPDRDVAEKFKRELYARACERLASHCDDANLTTGRFLQARQCLEAARKCREGRFLSPVVRDVIRYAGPVPYEAALYDM